MVDYLFEVSWEVCNKVGGIYTVVSSKSAEMKEYYKDGYYLVGPYFPTKVAGIFEEEMPPDKFKGIIEKLKQEGIECHYGKWLIKGTPNVILIDFSNYKDNNNYIKEELWNAFQIDSLNTEYFSYDEPITWGWAVGRFLDEFRQRNEKQIVGHFHEWLTGGGLLYLNHKNIDVKTVFTTHATVLGRTLASSGYDMYNHLDDIDADKEAKNRGVIAKHLTEKACAQHCEVFTTVSEITGLEAEKILERRLDVLLPNGLDLDRFPTFEETSIQHRNLKNKIKEFIMSFLFPYHTFDIDDLMIFFLAGRYEFKDKGIDIYINALEKLNDRLKEEKGKHVVAFIWVPANVKAIKPEILANKTLFRHIKDKINDHIDELKNSVLHCMLSDKKICEENILRTEDHHEIRRMIMQLRKSGNAPLSTHDLYDEHDQIMDALIKCGLDNRPDDKVQIIYYPIYLSGADSLLNTTYYESIIGSHLGVFPSFYEPWGYTPLESGALGVPAITTDLSGFGKYIQPSERGIWVLERLNKSDEDVTNQLSEKMYEYVKMNKRERVNSKMAARAIAEKCTWKNFIKNYINAHNKCFE